MTMQRTPTLNPRRQTLLEIIVGDYIQTASPVASQQLVKRHELNVSPATIRNDMAELEEMGFISRPHTSAGGVPEDSAYRFYVERAARRARPTRQFELLVHGSINLETADPDAWAKQAASLLSSAVQNVAIATSPRAFHARVKQLQLVQLQDRQALLVLVLQDARVRQHIVQFEQPIAQDRLTELATSLNAVLSDKAADGVRTAWDAGQLTDPLGDPVVTEVLQLLENEEHAEPRHRYTEGMRHMLGQPEFQSATQARDAVEILEEDQALDDMFSTAAEADDVDVIIGGESRHKPLRPYSVVLAPYGLPGQVIGVIGAVGPTRMDYDRAIASVRYLAGFLSGLVSTLEDAQG